MRYLYAVLMTLFITGCARTEFVATPNPEEIASVRYQLVSGNEIQTWHFINNNLTVRYRRSTINNKVISSRVKKLTPNDFNWLVTEIEKTKYTRLYKSSKVDNPLVGGRQQKPARHLPEMLTIETLGGEYVFKKGNGHRIPFALSKIVRRIPVFF